MLTAHIILDQYSIKILTLCMFTGDGDDVIPTITSIEAQLCSSWLSDDEGTLISAYISAFCHNCYNITILHLGRCKIQS